ncbi:DNA-methyltransferase [Oceanibaculum pacificum]|uniref:DNA-methyltransferase n=1 Tax=Oceanibaculum pacificum TaxID=580166 RepID=UPI000A0669F8|nr:site-specific DNA-methyltransferase [Oceanibaculum pacificum]
MLKKFNNVAVEAGPEKIELIDGGDKALLPDIKPTTPVSSFDRTLFADSDFDFAIEDVAPVVGFSRTFINKVVGRKQRLDASDVVKLLDQDAFSETFVPRSKIIQYLTRNRYQMTSEKKLDITNEFVLLKGDAIEILRSLPSSSIQCVVTSTPYWGLRLYDTPVASNWADDDRCSYGHEQTPEGFIRHTTEILYEILRVLKHDGSVWWNVMDSFNTRTQIRGNAVEALRAMQGNDKRKWSEHDCRRYSAGHAYLKDGEQCLIPSRIAERASRMGFFVKSMVTWAKTATLPEPQNSRVSRNLEYVIHLSKVRTPKFNKEIYRRLPAALGGRNNGWETDKLSDVWTLPTSSGRDGHGAQFPVALPGRCLALTTDKDDLVLDPFVGAGNSGVAALALGRRFIGIDVSEKYLETARKKLNAATTDRREVPLSDLPTLVENTSPDPLE